METAAGKPLTGRKVADQFPESHFDGTGFFAPVALGAGNWNLRLVLEAEDGQLFRQRVIVKVPQ